jgi:DNA repair exonuclease SbcCD ATPase subunit
MRLQSITLANFRGFADRQTVSLDGDIVVIWGANGTGKTSLFDALQWALVGDVPRLAAASLRKKEDPVISRYATGAPFVSIELQNGDGVWTINRTGGESSKSRLTVAAPDGWIKEDDDAQEFVRDLIGHEDVSLRTYLLQQDDMTELLSGDTRERYRFLADLTGLDGLRRLDEQLRSELRMLRSGVRERQEELESQRQHVAAAQRELVETRGLIGRQRAEREERLMALATTLAGELGVSVRDADDLETRAQSVLVESQGLLNALAEAQRRLEGKSVPDGYARELGASVERLEHEIRATDVRQSEIAAEIDELRRVAAEHQKRRDDLQQLAVLALEHLGPPCPVCGQDHPVVETRARLTALLDAGDESEGLSRRVAHLEAQYTELRQTRRGKEGELENVRARQRAVDNELSLLAESRSSVSLARQSLQLLLGVEIRAGSEVPAVQERVSALEQRLTALVNARRELEQVKVLETRTSALEDDFAGRTARLEATQHELAQLLDRQSRAESVCRWVGQQAEQISAEIMDRAAPLADAIFRRFDVHPTFRRFAFRPDRVREAGHLRPWVFDDVGEEDGNAVQVLSAAQLNALAVSLFLALNLEERSNLEVALLDDPVQNMDDLNVLSLIDVLRTLRSRRQIVLTTHDVVLAQLLQSKLRPLAEGQRTLLVKLSRWTPRGPVVEPERRDWEPRAAAYELVTGHADEDSF